MLTAAHDLVLSALATGGAADAAELAAALDLDPGVVALLLADLEAEGLVRGEDGAEH